MKKVILRKIVNQGFSIIELLLVMAIISIVASSILVLVSSQRQRAHQGKILAEFSGVIQPVLTCMADGLNVNNPDNTSGGDIICSSTDSHGTWPVISMESGFSDYSAGGFESSSSWFFGVNDANVKICCNAKNSRCTEIEFDAACDGTNP